MKQRGGNLPDFNYFLNNGREGITPAEQTAFLTALGKAISVEAGRKGQDGPTLSLTLNSRIECVDDGEEPEAFPGYSDGVSLEEFVGTGGMVVKELPAKATVETPVEDPIAEAAPEASTEPPRSEPRDCEKRPRGLWADYDEGQPSHPDDCGHA